MRCMPIPIIMYLPILYTLCCYKIPSPEWNKGCSALCITISQSFDKQHSIWQIHRFYILFINRKSRKTIFRAAQQGGYDRCRSHWVLIYVQKDRLRHKTIDTDKNFQTILYAVKILLLAMFSNSQPTCNGIFLVIWKLKKDLKPCAYW